MISWLAKHIKSDQKIAAGGHNIPGSGYRVQDRMSLRLVDGCLVDNNAAFLSGSIVDGLVNMQLSAIFIPY
jgi:hypothetical protein